MSLYTKYGDSGFTFTKLSKKTPKNHALVDFLGNLDELNCSVGYLSSVLSTDAVKIHAERLQHLMNLLFEIGAFVGYGSPLDFEKLKTFISDLEKEIDEQEGANVPLANFILPTGTPSAAWTHVCRAVARRVERSIYEMEIMAEMELVIQFLNRVSDYFFSLARTLNRIEGGKEIIWQSSK
jgi:cob(I)alamin adenosyltransferase